MEKMYFIGNEFTFLTNSRSLIYVCMYVQYMGWEHSMGIYNVDSSIKTISQFSSFIRKKVKKKASLFVSLYKHSLVTTTFPIPFTPRSICFSESIVNLNYTLLFIFII